MIRGEHTIIRMADLDDAHALKSIHDPERPRAVLFDRKREPVFPTLDEMREVLAKKEATGGIYYAIEDKAGLVHGFCSLRGLNPEIRCGEFGLMWLDESDYDSPLASEAMAFVSRLSFERMKLRKIMAQCLDGETAFRCFLGRNGFRSEGVVREATFTLGRWHGVEQLALFRADTPYAGGAFSEQE